MGRSRLVGCDRTTGQISLSAESVTHATQGPTLACAVYLEPIVGAMLMLKPLIACPRVWVRIWRSMLTVFTAGLVSLLGLLGWASFAAPVLANSEPPILAIASLFHFSGQRPEQLGITAGKLAACPASPNCVSSQSPDGGHRIAPLRYSSTPQEAFERLQAIVRSQPRTEVITATDNYLYAEFTSSIMGFVDDVEFYLDPAAEAIQVRSASRLGESDLGVNRQRIEAIRQQFNSPLAGAA